MGMGEGNPHQRGLGDKLRIKCDLLVIKRKSCSNIQATVKKVIYEQELCYHGRTGGQRG